MTTLTLSATEARNNFFPLLERIAKGEIEVMVKKMDSQITIVMSRPKIDANSAKLARQSYGLLKNAAISDFKKKSKDKQFLDKLRNQPW